MCIVGYQGYIKLEADFSLPEVNKLSLAFIVDEKLPCGAISSVNWKNGFEEHKI